MRPLDGDSMKVARRPFAKGQSNPVHFRKDRYRLPPYMLDAATTAVLVGFAIILVTAFILKFSRVQSGKRFTIFLTVSTVVWFVLTVLGEFITGWATNNICYRYLGCNDGFFGYDAMEHLLFGFALMLALLWLSTTFPKLSLVTQNRIKTLVTLIAFVALAAVIWEMFECAWDQYRVVILHETLFSFKLHIDALSQSSNLDTMGDISFSLFGALIASGIAEFLRKGILKAR